MKIKYVVEALDSQDDWSRLAEALGGEDFDVVRNILRHLRVLDAKSYVLEDPYIDRDYSVDYPSFLCPDVPSPRASLQACPFLL